MTHAEIVEWLINMEYDELAARISDIPYAVVRELVGMPLDEVEPFLALMGFGEQGEPPSATDELN